MIMWPSFFFILIINDCCCTNVYRSLSDVLCVRCRMFGVQQTNHVLLVPVWVAPAQEDEDHIPFFCLRMFSEKFHDFSEFQWDPVRFLTSLHGFVVSLNRLHVSSVLVLVMWAEILSWGQLDPSTDLGLLCSFSLIRELVIPVKIKVNYVWMPA